MMRHVAGGCALVVRHGKTPADSPEADIGDSEPCYGRGDTFRSKMVLVDGASS